MRARGIFLIGAMLAACDSHPRQMFVRDPVDLPPLWDDAGERYFECRSSSREETSCLGDPRPIRGWGPATFASPPIEGGYCPLRVRVTEAGAIAEGMRAADFFDAVPHHACVPDRFAVGTRRALKVEDGWLIAYTGAFDGEAYWQSEDGSEARFITRARLAGFVRSPAGTILALGIGQARLGQGGVIALDRVDAGVYVPRLVATLPVRPSAVVFADEGKILTFAQGFVVRIDEAGTVENLHYVGHDVGKVSSITRATPSGDVYLGLDCGVLRLRRTGTNPTFREEWWSAAGGAAGQWPRCTEPLPDPEGQIVHVVVRPIY